MYALTAVVAWYALGAVSAALLVHRGHSATLWVVAAALVGGLVALPLLISAIVRPQGRLEELEPTAGDRDAPVGHRVAVWLDPDEEGPTLARSLGAVPVRAEEVCLVRRIGFESWSSWIDTGERVVATRQVRWIHVAARAEHRRFLGSGSRSEIGRALAREAGPIGFHVVGGNERRRLSTSVAPLLEATGVPVLVLPSSATKAPRTIRPLAHRELAA